MSERLVINTDVLIDYLRDHEAATAYLETCTQPLALSVISVAELYVGVRDGEERSRLNDFISAFETLSIDTPIAIQAGLWRRNYGRSHGTGLADALIASSASAAQATLVTLNRKHFPMLADVLVPYSKP